MKAQPLGDAVLPPAAPPVTGPCYPLPTPECDPPQGAERFREHYEREFAWLRGVSGLSNTMAEILAARSAASDLAMHGLPGGEGHGDALISLLSPHQGGKTSRARVPAWFRPDPVWRDSPKPLPGSADELEALWPLAASTKELLSSGGDERLSLNPASRANKYGCTPWPRHELISFSSCTASCPTQRGFDAAESERRHLLADAVATSPARALANAADRIVDALLHHYGVADVATAVLAASGTDAALLATGLLAAEHPGCALTSVLVSPSETGSGVPNAVQGRHFAAHAPGGHAVGKGEPIDGLARQTLSLVTVELRDASGEPRPDHSVLDEMVSAIAAGLQKGRVVLHAMDGSKTGLTAPSRAACVYLVERFGQSLDIVIDACQARLEPTVVRWYLEQGFPVLVTGSKFFTAPGFCGAVLFPRERFDKITQCGRLPPGLAAYARLQDGFGSRRCPGLVLRWAAALAEMAAFSQLACDDVRTGLRDFARGVQRAIDGDKRLRLVAAPRPMGLGWSDCPSVLTFKVRGPTGWMATPPLRSVYEGLSGSSYQIGQPVELGRSGVAGLRLAISAPQLSSGGSSRSVPAELFSDLVKALPCS